MKHIRKFFESILVELGLMDFSDTLEFEEWEERKFHEEQTDYINWMLSNEENVTPCGCRFFDCTECGSYSACTATDDFLSGAEEFA